MIKGMQYEREDTCPICRAKRSLDLYDSYDKRIYFSNILDRNKLDKLHSKKLYYIKCCNCGTKFKINWSKPNHIPVPLLGKEIKYFLEDFSNYG